MSENKDPKSARLYRGLGAEEGHSSETAEQITPANWKAEADKIHNTCMHNMCIHRGTEDERTFLTLAFAGEAGELANVQKKIWRDGMSPELQRQREDEIADNLIYLDHLCISLNLNKDEICARKLEEVRNRPYARYRR